MLKTKEEIIEAIKEGKKPYLGYIGDNKIPTNIDLLLNEEFMYWIIKYTYNIQLDKDFSMQISTNRNGTQESNVYDNSEEFFRLFTEYAKEFDCVRIMHHHYPQKDKIYMSFINGGPTGGVVIPPYGLVMKLLSPEPNKE